MLPMVIDTTFEIFHLQPLPFIHKEKLAKIVMNSGHLFVSSERKVFIPDSTKDFSIDASDTEQLKCAYALVKKNHVDVENTVKCHFKAVFLTPLFAKNTALERELF